MHGRRRLSPALDNAGAPWSGVIRKEPNSHRLPFATLLLKAPESSLDFTCTTPYQARLCLWFQDVVASRPRYACTLLLIRLLPTLMVPVPPSDLGTKTGKCCNHAGLMIVRRSRDGQLFRQDGMLMDQRLRTASLVLLSGDGRIL